MDQPRDPLTNVVVAALKEAFDRDHARLELERAQLDEQRRRAEEAMRAEIRRQAADREIGRLRLLAATALIGWIASVSVLVARLASASTASRVVIAVAVAAAARRPGRCLHGAGPRERRDADRLAALDGPRSRRCGGAVAADGRSGLSAISLLLLSLSVTKPGLHVCVQRDPESARTA